MAKIYDCIVLIGGNHQIRIVHKKSGTVIPIPHHGKCVNRVYVKELNELFNEIEKGERQ